MIACHFSLGATAELSSLPLVEIMGAKGREKDAAWLRENDGEWDTRERVQREERVRESDKKIRYTKCDRKTGKEIKRGNGRERSWGWQHRKLPSLSILRVSLPLCL